MMHYVTYAIDAQYKLRSSKTRAKMMHQLLRSTCSLKVKYQFTVIKAQENTEHAFSHTSLQKQALQ